MKRLILYSTVGCHLCEAARQVIGQTLGIDVTEVDIAERNDLLARYGTRIPVLQRTDTGAELDWPFGAGDVRAWWQPGMAESILRKSSFKPPQGGPEEDCQ